MTKADFIQHVLIRSLPKPEKIDAGFEYAEWLWQEASKKGYGESKAPYSQRHTNINKQHTRRSEILNDIAAFQRVNSDGSQDEAIEKLREELK